MFLNNQILSDMVELQKAKEHNDRLDTEIRALRDRVRSLDSERKTLLKMVGIYFIIGLRMLPFNDCFFPTVSNLLFRVEWTIVLD